VSDIRRILVADGDQSIRSLVSLTLSSDSCVVFEAANADQALAQVAENVPQVALVDQSLPGDGPDACRRIKRSPLGAGIRTVLLVPKSEVNEAGARNDPNVDALLTKPFTSLALLRKVDEMLEDVAS